MALSDEDKAYFKGVVDEARGILSNDYGKQALAKLNEVYPKKSPEDGGSDSGDDDSQDGNGPKTPPKKENPNEPAKPPKRARWWPEDDANGDDDAK